MRGTFCLMMNRGAKSQGSQPVSGAARFQTCVFMGNRSDPAEMFPTCTSAHVNCAMPFSLIALSANSLRIAPRARGGGSP